MSSSDLIKARNILSLFTKSVKFTLIRSVLCTLTRIVLWIEIQILRNKERFFVQFMNSLSWVGSYWFLKLFRLRIYCFLFSVGRFYANLEISFIFKS